MTEFVQDDFEQYFMEKIWESIPAIYRHEDGIGENPGVLRAMVEIIGKQAAVLRRSSDRLWEDQFIELCRDWVVPYIGDLVGTRPLSALNKRGRRVDVAKTIYYRRRKGTLRVLEELISDITGWEGKVVEAFRRLGRARHGLDPKPESLAGRSTGTMPGGWADLRHRYGAESTGGPFEEFHRTADMRRHKGRNGRYNIPKLAFHLYRLGSHRVEKATPFALGDDLRFTCDPSGRDTPLFSPRQRPENWDDWRSVEEWELPAPISCLLLGHGPAKEALLPEAIGIEQSSDSLLGPDDVVSADLSEWPIADPGVRCAIDPDRGRFQFFDYGPETGSAITYYCGFSAQIGAGAYGRPEIELREPTVPAINVQDSGALISADLVENTGVYQIDDSATYRLEGDIPEVLDLKFQAANGQRPYIRLEDREYPLSAGTDPDTDAKLLLDGLWIGGDENAALVLQGDYEEIVITHCTFDPGGSLDVNGDPVPPIHLFIEAQVETLLIDHCIMGRISTRNGGLVENLKISDSIVDATTPDVLALESVQGQVELSRVTVFGMMRVGGLQASEALITGLVEVTDTQNGCFRFSAALRRLLFDLSMDFLCLFEEGEIHDDIRGQFSDRSIELSENVTVRTSEEDRKWLIEDKGLRHAYLVENVMEKLDIYAQSRLPKRYESHDFNDSGHFFTSRRFGHPGYAQLSETAPAELFRGAENGSEIGAFSYLMNPIKLDGLQAKVHEYMPFGLIPIFITET